jgi:AcrR family transcriptional regulator
MPRIRASSIREHKDLTRREILDAAAALFRAQGYGDTHLGDIAGYVGIGRTTLYEYFSDKEDILASLVEETVPGVVEDMLRGLPPALRARERLAELIQRGLTFVSTDENLGSMLMRETPRLSNETQRRVRGAHRPLQDEIVRVVETGIESGELRNFEPALAAQIVYGLMMSASTGLIRDADAKQRLHEVADTVVSVVFEGLAATGGSSD